MRYSALDGGKRIRALLCYAASELCNTETQVADAAASAVELIHAYSLVHDDMPCMDDDDLRRGKPTCHKAYDEATALLAGDALQSLAFQILASDTEPALGAARRLEMIEALARAIGPEGMAGGQAIDLESVGRKLAPPQLEDMHRRKTGALIRAAVRLGALARAGADAHLLAALDEYGAAVGLAFQIADDILDVEGSTETLGKTAGSDATRGKPTYPAVIGLAAAKNRAQELLAAALESLKPLGDNGRTLAGLAGYIIQRTQ